MGDMTINTLVKVYHNIYIISEFCFNLSVLWLSWTLTSDNDPLTIVSSMG